MCFMDLRTTRATTGDAVGVLAPLALQSLPKSALHVIGRLVAGIGSDIGFIGGGTISWHASSFSPFVDQKPTG